MTEKVEYFGNKDIMLYLLACFVIGITIGVSFAHYKNVRFGLISARIKTIKSTHERLIEGYASITDKGKTKLYDEVQLYKGRSFDTGCTNQDGIFKFNVTYTKKPKLLMSNNGILVNSTTTLGLWQQKVDFDHDESKITIKSIKPAA